MYSNEQFFDIYEVSDFIENIYDVTYDIFQKTPEVSKVEIQGYLTFLKNRIRKIEEVLDDGIWFEKYR